MYWTGLVAALLIVALVWFDRYRRHIDREIDHDISEIMMPSAEKSRVVSMRDIAHLPLIVQKWMINSGVVGKAPIQSVRISQKGHMRLSPEKPWHEMDAYQYCRLDEPAFVWKAHLSLNRLFGILGVDRFYNGKGRMRLKFLSSLTIAESEGEELSHGTMVRFLDEMIWYPSMAMSPLISWEVWEDTVARATFNYKGRTVSGVFEFTEEGRVKNFHARRYMERDGQYSLEEWSTPMGDYRKIDGIEIPTRGTVIWHLKTGDFRWLDLEIVDVKYNLAG